MIIETCDEVVNQKDKIRVLDDAYPLGQIVGLDVYEALHLNTNKKIRITLGEIYKWNRLKYSLTKQQDK